MSNLKFKSVNTLVLVGIMLFFPLGCISDETLISSPTEVTADWTTNWLETGDIDTSASIDAMIISPETGYGFGKGLVCGNDECWITSPFGESSLLFHWANDLSFLIELPPETGINISLRDSTPFLSGQDGPYSSMGLLYPYGRVGNIDCHTEECAFITQNEITTESGPPIFIEKRPLSIAFDAQSLFWQNASGHVESRSGIQSTWFGPPITQMQLTEDYLWVGVPNLGCILQFERELLTQTSEFCGNTDTFGWDFILTPNEHLVVAAPHADGGYGRVEIWNGDNLIDSWQGEELGSGFGTSLGHTSEYLFIAAPFANSSRGKIYQIPYNYSESQ